MGMMLETIAISVTCASCGSHLSLPKQARDDESAVCGGCGHNLGNWLDVREQARAAVFDALRDDFGDVLQARAGGARGVRAQEGRGRSHLKAVA